MANLILPGQIVGNLSNHTPGKGTYVNNGEIVASIAGLKNIRPIAAKNQKPTVSVSNSNTSSATILPQVGSVVLARVIRIQQRQLNCLILVVNPSSTSITGYGQTTDDEVQFQAILRKEDIRAYEKDKIVVHESFRVGDVIKASVISIGDERNYYITTAGNDFGTLIARSEAGNPMVPTSWKEMRDVVTGKGESRKVAKPS